LGWQPVRSPLRDLPTWLGLERLSLCSALWSLSAWLGLERLPLCAAALTARRPVR